MIRQLYGDKRYVMWGETDGEDLPEEPVALEVFDTTFTLNQRDDTIVFNKCQLPELIKFLRKIQKGDL